MDLLLYLVSQVWIGNIKFIRVISQVLPFSTTVTINLHILQTIQRNIHHISIRSLENNTIHQKKETTHMQDIRGLTTGGWSRGPLGVQEVAWEVLGQPQQELTLHKLLEPFIDGVHRFIPCDETLDEAGQEENKGIHFKR